MKEQLQGEHTVQAIKQYVRLANYLTVAQLFLQDNYLGERKLTFDDIKPRLLGHWGTCPGINFVYANLNYLIKKHNISTLFVLGPGHGFPALQANLFLESSLEKFYPEATLNADGVAYICKNFSWPYGFPSHASPSAPGVISEGGELGYALATSYGAALDNPDLLVACLIGDGEAETGPTAASWHINKFIDPATNGTVLPILHLNGYKIGGPTIFGRMSNKELKALFTGYGYEPIIVQEKKGVTPDAYQDMIDALEYCYQTIKKIKTGEQTPRFPMIILKTPKGWTGVKKLRGEKIEGNNLSHQIVLTNARKSKLELKALQNWLDSYQIKDLFDAKSGINSNILSIIPDDKYKMGDNNHAFPNRILKNLSLPNLDIYSENFEAPGIEKASSMITAGNYLRDVFKLNLTQKNIRFFSPDEIYSNKLDEILKATKRAFDLPIKKWDQDLATSGQVIEILSEHVLQGLAQGYILTGRHAIFASYEAFIDIVSSMAAQYAKFLKQAKQISWRGDYSSFNYILTSLDWRQDHNGFSHQNPAFTGTMLEKYCDFITAYYPADSNSTLVILNYILQTKNKINIIVAGKTDEPNWVSLDFAQKNLQNGLAIWDFASDIDPDIVICGIGDYLTNEALAAVQLLKSELGARPAPQIRVRFVNIFALSSFGIGFDKKLSDHDFEHYFTKDKPVIFNFSGYPQTLKAILFDLNNNSRFSVNGYIERGSTTTPFDMQIRNKTSRYDLVIQAIKLLADKIENQVADDIIQKYKHKINSNTEYIKKHGIDPKEIVEWQWKKNI